VVVVVAAAAFVVAVVVVNSFRRSYSYSLPFNKPADINFCSALATV
jgi:hypothetical protein